MRVLWLLGLVFVSILLVALPDQPLMNSPFEFEIFVTFSGTVARPHCCFCLSANTFARSLLFFCVLVMSTAELIFLFWTPRIVFSVTAALDMVSTNTDPAEFDEILTLGSEVADVYQSVVEKLVALKL